VSQWRFLFEARSGVWSIPTSSSRRSVPLLADLPDFIADHRPHGPLTAEATERTWNGYLPIVTCSCGVVFERWVTPEDAELDLLHFARLN